MEPQAEPASDVASDRGLGGPKGKERDFVWGAPASEVEWSASAYVTSFSCPELKRGERGRYGRTNERELRLN